ncbi:MAG: hypothetical protein WCE21_03880 [Candidatus Babeliales bacterium]
MIEKLDLSGGVITYNEFNIDPDLPLQEQLFSLTEDLLQISYCNGKYLIDVGWYPEFSVQGSFMIRVIKDYDWLNPIFKKKVKSLEMVTRYLQKAVKIVEEVLKTE